MAVLHPVDGGRSWPRCPACLPRRAGSTQQRTEDRRYAPPSEHPAAAAGLLLAGRILSRPAGTHEAHTFVVSWRALWRPGSCQVPPGAPSISSRPAPPQSAPAAAAHAQGEDNMLAFGVGPRHGACRCSRSSLSAWSSLRQDPERQRGAVWVFLEVGKERVRVPGHFMVSAPGCRAPSRPGVALRQSESGSHERAVVEAALFELGC
jgi:hypothetical protein